MNTHNNKNEVIIPISENLKENIKILEDLLQDCGDYVSRTFTVGQLNKADVYMAYTDNMVDREILEKTVIRNLIYNMDALPAVNQYDYVRDMALQSADIQELEEMDKVTHAIMSGDVILLVDGYAKALLISLKDFPGRGVPSVESEITIKGAKDSFTESIALNKVLIRRRIRDTHMKLENAQIGTRSRTDITIAYISGIAKDSLILEVKNRLNRFEIDGVFDVGMLEQLMADAWYSPFPQFQSTERPDKTASSLLEGRVAILVDNSPMVLLVPVTLSTFFQASDDYYSSWQVASFIRVLRYIGCLLAIALPGLYVAITNYQPEMIPTPLVLSYAAARLGVPFSIFLELLILQISFELLTEAGIRLPSPMGNTIGIVGGLIIGDAAISANLVSPMVVIVVAFTAIATFTIPNESFTSAFRIIKYMIIFLSAMLGLYGFILGLLLLLTHLAGLKSFGMPYLAPFVSADYTKDPPASDSILKFPTFRYIKRPIYAKDDQKIRLKEKKNMKN